MYEDDITFRSGFLVIVCLLLDMVLAFIIALIIVSLFLKALNFSQIFTFQAWRFWAIIIGLYIIVKTIRVANTK